MTRSLQFHPNDALGWLSVLIFMHRALLHWGVCGSTNARSVQAAALCIVRIRSIKRRGKTRGLSVTRSITVAWHIRARSVGIYKHTMHLLMLHWFPLPVWKWAEERSSSLPVRNSWNEAQIASSWFQPQPAVRVVNPDINVLLLELRSDGGAS